MNAITYPKPAPRCLHVPLSEENLRIAITQEWVESLLEYADREDQGSLDCELVEIGKRMAVPREHLWAHMVLAYGGKIDEKFREDALRSLDLPVDHELFAEGYDWWHYLLGTELTGAALVGWRDSRCLYAKGLITYLVSALVEAESISNLAEELLPSTLIRRYDVRLSLMKALLDSAGVRDR